MDEKRNFKRIRFNIDVTIEKDGVRISGRLVDLSMKGALVEVDDVFEFVPGRDYLLILYLVSTDLTLEFSSVLIHNRPPFYGFIFNDADIDTLTHLRNIILVNTGDEDESDREFTVWIDNE